MLEAARLIQEHCANSSVGSPCPFARKGLCDGFARCRIVADYIPSQWKLPKTRRWTDADVQIAKALAAFGVTRVRRINSTRRSAAEADDGTVYGIVPEAAFADLKPHEIVRLEDVIKEAEQK